jgi:hypothetical protein
MGLEGGREGRIEGVVQGIKGEYRERRRNTGGRKRDTGRVKKTVQGKEGGIEEERKEGDKGKDRGGLSEG